MRFTGSDYDHERDSQRLSAQMHRVWALMRDMQWRDLMTISALTGAPQASVSAQLRHLRKPRFGGHRVEKRYRGNGHYEYRVIPTWLL